MRIRRHLDPERGFTLIEVMVAAAILGIAATALFGLFSKSLYNLRKIEDLRHYQLAGEEVMNRILLLPSFPPDGRAEGSVKQTDARWTVQVTPWLPKDLKDKPAQVVMKIDVQILWPGAAGQRNLKFETIKPVSVAYTGYDFQRAIASVFPD